ncbi:MAG: FliA/WhiG family RNA polymerase sigma factor [Candidatus Delongbacteria bacterium]|nr:FliA/WhiG family RNA polymerase sigma factor [Candidatus Delongbacteria bacterium]
MSNDMATVWVEFGKTQDPALKEKLLVRYLPLVKIIASRMKISLPNSVTLDDLVGAGTMGLINSVEHFDPALGFKFETYAVPRIRGSILDGLRDFDWVPRSIRAKERQLSKAMLALEAELNRVPNDEELAARLELPLAEYYKMLDEVSATSLLSFDRPFTTDEGQATNLYDVIENQHNDSPLDIMERKEIKALMIKLINSLPEQERLVMALYYYEELTLKEIGQVLDISESRVSQIHTKIIINLKNKIRRLITA